MAVAFSYFVKSSRVQRSIEMISQFGWALLNISFTMSVLLDFDKLKLAIGSAKKVSVIVPSGYL